MSGELVKCDRFRCSLKESTCVRRYVASHDPAWNGDGLGCAGCPQGAARNGHELRLVPIRFAMKTRSSPTWAREAREEFAITRDLEEVAEKHGVTRQHAKAVLRGSSLPESGGPIFPYLFSRRKIPASRREFSGQL